MVNDILSGTKGSDLLLAVENINSSYSASPGNMTHSIANILNLPVELKQKIALNLSSKDYASLRESCLSMSQDIDDFSVLNNKIKLGCCVNEYKEQIKKIILNRSVIAIMKSGKEKNISHILNNILINKSKPLNGNLFISTSFFIPPAENVSQIAPDNNDMHWVKRGFMLFKDEMSNVIDNTKVVTYQKKAYPFVPWVVGVTFEDNFICYSQLKAVFTRLNNIFNQVSGKEKILIAVIADEFKSFWNENIPHGLVKSDISESARDAAELFTFVTEIKRVVQDNIY